MGIFPGLGVNGEHAHGRGADFALHGRPHHKGADAHSQFRQLDRGERGRVANVHGRSKSHSAAYGFALDAADDKLGASSYGVDDHGKTAEKIESFLLVLDGHKFIKTRTRTERTVAGRAEHDHLDVVGFPGSSDGLGQFSQQMARQAVGGGVRKGDGADPSVVHFRLDKRPSLGTHRASNEVNARSVAPTYT